jgi:photosystem II stability/assembly factor-like uncharacterized protein
VGYERLTFYDITENPTNAAILVGATSKGIFRTVDSGANWARVTVAGLSSTVLAAAQYLGSNIFGIDRAGRFYCSNDNGTSWNNVSLGALPAVPFRDLKIINNAVHILTDGGGVYTGFASTCP